jgi:hypothetical protein
MEFKAATSEFRATSKIFTEKQKALRLLKREVGVQKKQRLAEKKRVLDEIKKARAEALADPQGISIKQIKTTYKLKADQARKAAAVDLQALAGRLREATPSI